MEFKDRGNNDLYNKKALFTFSEQRNVGIFRSKGIVPSLLELIRTTGYEFVLMNYPLTETLLHVSAINCHPQGDVNTTDYIIAIHYLQIISVGNV
jgi:hypothetical protein